MLSKAILAALAALPAVLAEDVTSFATRCTTQYGYQALPSGSVVTTWYNSTTTTNYFSYTSTTHNTVVVTPTASTFTNVVTSVATIEVVTTSTPAATTIPAPSGFMPLLAVALPGPTGASRFKRYDIEGRNADPALLLFRRQTAANHTGGFVVDRNGTTSGMDRKYAQRVDCRVSVSINSTTTTTVTGLPETSYVAASTALVVSTSTISTTTTVTAILPRKTVYAACQANNVVSSVTGMTGEELVFDRVIYRPNEGFPIENELIVNTTQAENCCIACQNTAYCAGSFYVPSMQECHLRLTQAPTPQVPTLPAPVNYGNNSYGTSPSSSSLVVLVPTSTSSIVPSATATANTCAAGSMSLYLGTIEGQTDFPKDIALAFSNGPCGRLSVWPIPVNDNLDTSREDFKVKRLALE